jgi:hypothetical protein
MKKIWPKHKYLLSFSLIFLIGLFFRSFELESRFNFAHDADLYSWIAKDIIVDHHIRLIGQITSAPGIFIGPLFYYALVPFFMLFSMDPIGAAVLMTILAMLTLISYFYVFTKLFNKDVGLIAGFLQAVLLYRVFFDREAYPSTLTNIWIIWYLYVVLSLVRGNFKVLWILGVLIGLIWHIHIALAPTLLAIPVAILLSKKLPTIKQCLQFLVAATLSSLPLLLFEVRHNFSQSHSFLQNFTINHGGGTGMEKLLHVLYLMMLNANKLFLQPWQLSDFYAGIFFAAIGIIAVVLVFLKQLQLKELVTFIFWILGVIIFFTASSTQVSDYYFANVEVIYLVFAALLCYWVGKRFTGGKHIIIILLLGLLIKNASWFITMPIYHQGYKERKDLIAYLANDAQSKQYPCVGIGYITSQGAELGYRYFLWLYHVHVVTSSNDVPVYNIIFPDEYVNSPKVIKFGHIGLLPPDEKEYPQIHTVCQQPDKNTTEPVWGFTN